MNLKVKPSDDAGYWELHDDHGHICLFESKSTAESLAHMANTYEKLMTALRYIAESAPIPRRNGCYYSKDLAVLQAVASTALRQAQKVEEEE